MKPKVAAKKATAAASKPKPAAKKVAVTGSKLSKPSKTTAVKKRVKGDSDDENMDFDGDSFNDASLLSNTPPSSKKAKKAPAAKKTGGKPLESIENESFGMDGVQEQATAGGNGASKQKYQMLTQVEHILKRPDTYIGSVERTEQEMWVYNSESEMMENRKVNFVPGLYKIFDEILVNAADNKQNDPNMNEIRVTVDRESGEISVWNNGKGIPIEIHSEHGIYIPDMIFGHLLTSSNYDDEQQKVTGGRNGLGAKLCNVYSLNFTIETADSKRKQRYKQTWNDNMSKKGKAKITAYNGDDYTKVTFRPDYKRFGMDGMDDDFEALVKRRIYDVAGTCKKVKVKLNGDRVKINKFQDYMKMYTKALRAEQGGEVNIEKEVILVDTPNERWEIGFAVSDGTFKQVSFVNSIATTAGGSHVKYIADQIVNKLLEHLKKTNKKGVALKNHQIQNHFFLFINCLIVNPAFTSQTKEQLTTKSSAFGSKCQVSDKFLAGILKTEVVTNIMHFAEKKADQLLAKSDGSKRARMYNSKLTDANKAGTKDGWRCTLILTEGDSASGLALAGRAVVNPDLIGVFPLRGKLLNVRDASVTQISNNQEIQNIKKFMGLQHKKEYTDTKGLRYGHLMIMTDQDHDGSHIKGLLINFFESSYPSLLKIQDFLSVFITPIVKVWKGDIKHPKQLKSFFTMPEYEAWKEQHSHERGWDHKYFKGLGTSDNEDAEVYFRDLDRHLKQFEPMKTEEAAMIDLAFSKKKADARKNWLRDFVPGTYLDLTARNISYDDFVNKELILFSVADNLRSIPSVVDGLKPSQRKVMYTAFYRNLKKDMKVVELAGHVSGLTNYQYGDASLQQTIVALAQTFVGSNNINCLEPSGNFGSRRMGGGDAASARYIYTRLSPFARRIFHAADEALLKYHEDDGRQIEPHTYVPVVPLILLNGTDGIGTGWSTSIPNYKPEDVVENLKRRMVGQSKEDMLPMTPWFRGYKGTIEDMGSDRWKFSGIINQTGDNEVEITELPIRMWTQDFKDRLEEILKAEKVPSFIKDYVEYNTPTQVHFIIKMEDKHMKIAVERGLEETFKLTKSMATSNLVAFDGQGRIHKYENVLDIMEEFYHIRLKFYGLRKQHLLDEMQKDLDKLSNQARFIKMIIDGSLVVSKKKKAVLVTELKRLAFKPFPKVVDAKKAGEIEDVVEEEDESEQDGSAAGARDYDYLLGMAIWSLTQERVDKLKKQIGDKEDEITTLTKLSPKDLWSKDLDDFIEEWHKALSEEKDRAKKIRGMGRRASAKLGIGAGQVKGKKRKAGESDASDSDFAVSKKKAPKHKATSTLMSFFNQPTTVPKQAVTEKPKAEPEGVKDVAMAFDSDTEMGDMAQVVAIKKAPKGLSKPKVAPAPKPAATIISDDEDFFAAVANEVKEKKTTVQPIRQARAASKKKYVPSDDSDDSGDDMLGDVSMMVKGIGNNDETSASRLLFSATAQRPGSSHGLPKTKPRASKITDLTDGEDETDYTKLVPQGSPQRPAPRNANDTIIHDEDDEEGFGVTIPKAVPKVKAAKNGPSKAAAKPKAAVKKASTSEPAAEPKKPVTLSPAAKAYAARQAKGVVVSKPLPKKKKHADSDSEVNDLANDLLSDDDASSPPAAREARPGRRAAAKTKYVVSDDSEEEEDSEPSFDDDDDESD